MPQRKPLSDETVERMREDAGSIKAVVAHVWTCMAGPAAAFFRYKTSEDQDYVFAEVYEAWDCRGRRSRGDTVPGIDDLGKIVSWFPGAILEDARSANRRNGPATPETHVLVWREPPEVSFEDGHWLFYARFGFMPKGAHLVDLED